MKTAQGSISVDVSKFVAGIELATAKLLTLRESLERSSGAARVGFRAYDAALAIAAKIKDVKDQWQLFGEALGFVKNISQNIPQVFNSIKSAAQGAVNAVRNMPPLFQKLAVVAASAGAALYAINKTFGAINSVGRGVASTISSITSKLVSLSRAGISGVGNVLSGAFNMLGSAARTAGMALGAVGLSLGAIDRFFKIGITSAIELGDQYNNLSKRTGASVGFLYDLGKILKNNGSSAEYSSTAIVHMQRALTGVNELGQPTVDIFKRLKLNIDELQDDTPEKSVFKLGRAILSLKSPAEQSRAATEIFGKAGASMLAVFKDEAFEKLAKGTSTTGQTLQKNAENFSKISAQLRDSGSAFRGFFIELAGAVAPQILELFKLFQRGDTLSKFGKDLGASIKRGLDVVIGAFKTGNLQEMFKILFQIVATYAKDFLSRAFTTASNLLTRLFEGNVVPTIFGAFIDMFAGISEYIGGIFLKGFREPILFFKNTFDNIIQEIVVQLSEGLVSAIFPFSKQLKAAGINVPEKLGVRKGLEATGLILRPEQIAAKNEATIDAQIAKATGKDTGISSVARGAKDAFGVAVEVFKIVQDELSKMSDISPEAAGTIAELTGKLNAFAVAAQLSAEASKEITGQQELLPKTKQSLTKMRAEEAVSSLRKIGGGGGAFGGDPILREAETQTAIQRQMYEELRKLGYGTGQGKLALPVPTIQYAVFSG